MRALRAMPSRAPAAFAEDIDDYIGFLALERGLSEHTRIGYQSDLDQAATFLARRGATDWRRVPGATVAEWLQSLGGEDYTVASLARKLSALRGLARHLVKERRRTDDFSALLIGPKQGRKVPGTLTPEEVSRLLAAPAGGDHYALRDRAILEFFYASGLRVSELANLTLQQVDLEHGFVRVLGKGRKERVVPIGGPAREALETYLRAARPKFVKPRTGSHFFLSERGGPLSRVTLWVMIQGYAKQAGIRRRVKPHLLRHSFATHLLSGGADLRAIQEMLGHANLGTTQIYTAVDARRIVDHHTRFHPRNRAGDVCL